MIVIVGPTASGKTSLSLALARSLRGEVISADSRQVYRHLNAGTAKPPRDARGLVDGVPYHLIDIVDPCESFDAGRFAALAEPLCQDIRQRGLIPIVAGGTGLYLRALIEGLSEIPRGDPTLRQRLTREASLKGRQWLYRRLSQVDAPAAQKIPANNIQRIIRALEVYELTGRPISGFWGHRKKTRAESPEPLILSLHWPSEELKKRIISRTQAFWPEIVREVQELTRYRFKGSEPGFQSLGYREAILCAQGEISCEQGLEKLIASTLAYAKRQRTWFAHQISAIKIAGGACEAMLQEALKIIENSKAATPA